MIPPQLLYVCNHMTSTSLIFQFSIFHDRFQDSLCLLSLAWHICTPTSEPLLTKVSSYFWSILSFHLKDEQSTIVDTTISYIGQSSRGSCSMLVQCGIGDVDISVSTPILLYYLDVMLNLKFTIDINEQNHYLVRFRFSYFKQKSFSGSKSTYCYIFIKMKVAE